jgi:sugar transferase (PEP-CTERM/EpsH1 system associated)
MRKIRVAYITRTLHYGGVERYIVDLVNHLNYQTFEPHIVCFKEAGTLKEKIDPRVKIYELHKREGNDLTFPFTLARLLQQAGIDIVHSNNWATFVESTMAARLARIPVALHVQHGIELYESETPAKRYLRNRIRQVTAYVTDCVVVVCNATQHFVCNEWKTPAQRVRLIYNGVDLQSFKQVKTARYRIRQELGLSVDDVVIGSVGRFTRVKDYPTLLEAFYRIPQHKQVKLVLAGDGPEREKITALIKKYALTEQIRLLGRRADISAVLNGMDIFALASVSEGMSVAILEAMASQLPVVATAVGGNPEIIDAEVTGFLVPPGNPERMAASLCTLLDNPQQREAMGLQGRIRVENLFSLEKMIETYEMLYLSLLEKKRVSRGKAYSEKDEEGAFS